MQGNRERGCFGLATGAFAKDARKGCRRGSLAHQRCSEGRKRREGTRLAKLAGGWRNWRVAGANMRQKCFSQNMRALGVFTALGFVKALFGGSLGLGGLYGSFWGLWGSAGFVRAQGGIALRFPLSFHRFIIISN